MVKIDFEMPSNCYDCCFVGLKEKDGKRTFACDILRTQGKTQVRLKIYFKPRDSANLTIVH